MNAAISRESSGSFLPFIERVMHSSMRSVSEITRPVRAENFG